MKLVSRLAGPFLFLFSPIAFSATLSIIVLEKGTADPVEGATVVLMDSGEYDSSDVKGLVRFDDVDIPKKIKVLSSGYETIEQSVQFDNNKFEIYLYPLVVEGDALEVVEERVQEKTSKVILTAQELRRVPGTAGDPLKMLESMPGIVAGSGQGGPGQIYVRGSGAEDNGVLINRIPVEYLFHFGDLSTISPSTINPSLVKDFNAFLGGFPVDYDDKLGGMLDVQLRNPKTDRLHQTYRAAIHEASFLVEGPFTKNNKKDSFYAAGRMSYLDRILTPEIINDLINSNNDNDENESPDFSIVTLPRYYDAQANWHRELNKGYLDLYYFTAGDSVAVNINADETNPEVTGDLIVDLDYHSVGFNWLHRYNNHFSQIGTWSVRRFNARQQIGTDRITGENFFVETKTTFAAFDPQLKWRINSKHELTFGSNIAYVWTPINLYITVLPSEDNVNYSFSTAEKYRIDDTLRAGTFAGYIKHYWNITPKFRSRIGLRYSYARADDGIELSGLSPRAAMEFQFTRKLLLTASWGKYLQFPPGASIVSGIGNPNLEYTQAEHRILGAHYELDPLWNIRLEAYHKPMDKLVLFIPGKRAPENYENLGEGEAYGIDVLLKREYSNRTMGWLSYSYARTSRTTVAGEDRNFSGDQPHTLSMVWSKPMPGSWKRWTWGAKLSIHSGALHTPIIGRTGVCFDGTNYSECGDQPNAEADNNFSHWEPIKEKQNSERLPFYYQMSVRFDREIRFNSWTMNVFLDVQNLTFRKNIIGYNYGKKYQKIKNREEVSGIYFPIPLIGVEAEF